MTSFQVTTAYFAFNCPGCRGLVKEGRAMVWVINEVAIAVPYTPLCWGCGEGEVEYPGGGKSSGG